MGHGGTREGAGRRSNAKKLLEAGFVAPWFTHDFQEIKWKKLLRSDDENIELATMKYLTDRLYGKAKERVEHEGKVTLETLVAGILDDHDV